jgi:N-acetylglucosamine-6-phosphate deacetylase
VRNAVRLLGLPVAEALRMASLYPATALGLAGAYGRLAPGRRADLAVLDNAIADPAAGHQ